MVYIGSVGLGVPDHRISQADAKRLAENQFSGKIGEIERFLPVFDHAAIEERQLVVGLEWFESERGFKDRNTLYTQTILTHTLTALDNCLTNTVFLTKNIPYDAIDLIVFVSSTGLSTPSMDAHLMNARPFREDVVRMPLWGLGCAGGAIGLSHAFTWLEANPDKNAVVICAETASLTFQHNDTHPSNLIGTALFGDGMAAALLLGQDSRFRNSQHSTTPVIQKHNARTIKDTMPIMGWEVVDTGFEVVFSKKIPSLVQTVWKEHVLHFLKQLSLDQEDIHSYIVHPGGRKVLEAMENTLDIEEKKLQPSRDVLREHGNMSSPTVLYALEKWMKKSVPAGEKSILSALGPGFSSELLLLEWV